MVNLSTTTPLLAGVCAQLADLFRFNAWVLRAIFILLLLTKTLVAVVAYGLLALGFQLADSYRRRPGDVPAEESPASPPKRQYHNPKLAELDRRFREWEDSLTGKGTTD